MRVDGYMSDVSLVAVVEFTAEEVLLMILCSARHYDAQCREASSLGGFLTAIHGRCLPGSGTVKSELTTRQLDLLSKILEVEHAPFVGATQKLRERVKGALRNALAEHHRLREQFARSAEKTPPPGRCPSIHNRWRCSEPAVGPHVHALRDADGRPIAVWLDDGRLLLTPELPGEGEAFDAADEQDEMLALALLDDAHSIAQCTIDVLAEGGGEAAKRSALLAVELLHELCCMIAQLEASS